jgi:negative regulator of flagellin synthesis FlgM
MKVGQTGSYPIQKNDSASTQKTAQSSSSQASKKTHATSPQEGERNTSGARTDLSAKAKEFSQAKKIASQAPDVREDRVAELKRRIADGSYQVDADSIADRLVDDHLRMSDIH